MSILYKIFKKSTMRISAKQILPVVQITRKIILRDLKSKWHIVCFSLK